MQAVKDRLATLKPLTGRVYGAAKLSELLTERGPMSATGTSAFVLPLGLRGGAADAATGLYRQSLDRIIGIVLVVRNVGDQTGEKAMLELDPLIEDVIQLFAGWSADPDSFAVFVLARGELVSIEKGTITYQLDFAIEDQLRIARP